MRLIVKGQEVVVAKAPEEPWKELHFVEKVTITDYLEQGRSEEAGLLLEDGLRLSCPQLVSRI